MKHLALAQKNREVEPRSWELLREKQIERKIRRKYSVNNELAILRQRDTKPEEFAEYNAYVEQCKAEVNADMGLTVKEAHNDT